MTNQSYIPVCHNKWIQSESRSREAVIDASAAKASSDEEKSVLKKKAHEVFRHLYKQTVCGFTPIICDVESMLDRIAPDTAKRYDQVNEQYATQVYRMKQRIKKLASVTAI